VDLEIRIPLDPLVAEALPKGVALTWTADIDHHTHDVVVRFHRAVERSYPGIPYPDDVEEGQAPFPHCDELVLHAPGECEFCDHYPARQRQRERDGVNFTGHHDPGKRTCPAEVRRDLATLEAWGGNVAAQGGTLRHHAPAQELRPRAWWLYGDRAEPAHADSLIGRVLRFLRRYTDRA
jgi:hypothetical protein